MRITVKEASDILEIPVQTLRLWIQSGKCKFGEVVIDGKRKTYYINRERLQAYMEGKL